MKVWGLTDQGLTEKWRGPEIGVLLGGVKKQRSGFVGIQYTWVVVKIMGPLLGTVNIRCRIIIGIQKGPIILTTTHIAGCVLREVPGYSCWTEISYEPYPDLLASPLISPTILPWV